MHTRIFCLALSFAAGCAFSAAYAQSLPAGVPAGVPAGATVPANVDVKQVPQSQINQAQQMLQNSGLSTSEAIELARQRGATDQQIQDYMQRTQGGAGAQGADTSGAGQGTGQGTGQGAGQGAGQGGSGTGAGEGSANQAGATDTETKGEGNTPRQAAYDLSSRVFGSYLFNSKNLTFEPNLNIQTPKSYEIGIGDELIINIWGNAQNNYQLVVNRNGQVLVPDVGPIYVAGLTFDNASKKIKERLSSIYAGMAGSNPTIFAQVNMGQLRSIKVNLLGEVVTPGSYTLPVTATLFNALYLSGGPNNIGSFRNIKLIRDDKELRVVDIYRFLIQGDPSDNIGLKDGDIIMIPPAEKRVEVKGVFKRTGMFELKEKETLADLITFAGGYTETSYQARIQIYRKTQQGTVIRDIPFADTKKTALQNGDEVSNSKILDVVKNKVTISGSVFRPGTYEWTPGMTLLDLIGKADSLTPDVFQNRGTITRVKEDMTTVNIPFDVASVVARQQTFVLQPLDSITVESIFGMAELRHITVAGEVLRPGTFAFSDRISLSDAIFMAGGFTLGADSTYIEVARMLKPTEAAQLTDRLLYTYTLTLARDLKLKDTGTDFYLEPFDRVYVRRAPGYRTQGSVSITGEVKYAGMFSLSTRSQRISDLVQLAGGLTPQAFVEGARLTRMTTDLGTENVFIDLGEILSNPGKASDLYLRAGDQIYIPEVAQTVKISGQVQNPFSLTFQERKSLKYYIDHSGGYTATGDKKRTYVLYADGTTALARKSLWSRNPVIRPGSQIIVPTKPEKKEGNFGTWVTSLTAFSSLLMAFSYLLK